MDIEMDLLCDFSVNIPRVIVSGNYAILDNVNKILSFTDKGLVADTGLRFTSVNGENIRIKDLKDHRLIITGNIISVEFLLNKKGD